MPARSGPVDVDGSGGVSESNGEARRLVKQVRCGLMMSVCQMAAIVMPKEALAVRKRGCETNYWIGRGDQWQVK